MLRIVNGSGFRKKTDSIVGRYRSENWLSGSSVDYENIILALDEIPVGFISLRSDRIDVLYTVEDAPEGTEERLLRSAMALSMNRGRSSISIHCIDPRGRTERICRHAGFTEDGMCTCSQREGTVCLRLMF